MNRSEKASRFGFATAALAGALAMAASAASAQTYSASINLYNNNTIPSGVTIDVIHATGFYEPVDTAVPAGGSTDGRLRTSGSFGVSQWVVHANIDSKAGEYCYFGFTMNNSDGTISGVSALRTGTGFSCNSSQIGRSLFFYINP